MTPTGDSRARQVALITGGNTGIGRVAARELVRRGFHVFVACRSAERAQPVLDEVRAAGGSNSIEMLPLDLADFESVRTCARVFLD
jgi:retinol dehydrogenase-12